MNPVSRPLRIAFVAYRGNMRCGGQGIYLWFLARELARRGHHIDVFVGPPYPDPMPFANRTEKLPNPQFWGKWFEGDRTRFFPEPNPFRVFEPLNFYELGASLLGFLPEPAAFSVRAFARLAQELRRGVRYDLVHDVQCLGYGLLGLRALGLPVVTTVHHPLSVDRRASFVRDQSLMDALGTMEFHPVGMQAFVARRLDRVITSSHASGKQIEQDFGVSPERLRMLGNGVDTTLFAPRPSVMRREREVLCVARASDPTKGVLRMVNALAQLPDDVRLTLVDQDGPSHPARARAATLGCEDRVEVTGRVSTDTLVNLYSRAALVVVPSRYEGFGLPAVEAMSCGTPVVATAVGALPEVVRACGGGVIVEDASALSLAKAIQALLEQPETRAQLGARGRQRADALYAWPRVAAATEEVYRELVGDCAVARGLPARTTTSARDGTALAS